MCDNGLDSSVRHSVTDFSSPTPHLVEGVAGGRLGISFFIFGSQIWTFSCSLIWLYPAVPRSIRGRMRSAFYRILRPRTIVDLIKTSALFVAAYVCLQWLQAPLWFLQSAAPGFTGQDRPTRHPEEDLPCRSLPGANDTLVVIKTGVTEFAHKLPVHIDTTIKCYPNYLIYSDHEETFKGEQIHDSLATLPSEIKEGNDDFEFYRRVRAGGRQMLDQKELSDKPGFNRHPSNEDKLLMGGWRLDKWKFLSLWNDTSVHHFAVAAPFGYIQTERIALYPACQ